MSRSRFWIAGIYENYDVAGLGSTIQLTPGINYGKTKSYLAGECYGELTVIHDPVYTHPTAGSFQQYSLEMASAYLHNQLSRELCVAQQTDTLTLHSPLDIYAEYLCIFPRRVKWVDDVIRAAIWQVDRIYYLSTAAQYGAHYPDPREDKYHANIRRLMHDMKVKFVMPSKYEDVPRRINEYRLTLRGKDAGVGIVTADSEVYGIEAEPNRTDPEASS